MSPTTPSMRRWSLLQRGSFSTKRWSTISKPASARRRVSQCGRGRAWRLSRLSTGVLVIADREVKLSGDALYGIAADQIRASLASDLPQGWKANAEVSVRPAASLVDPTVCQQLFADLFRKGQIRFETGQAKIDPDSGGPARPSWWKPRCGAPAANLEIAGHTDLRGDEMRRTRHCPRSGRRPSPTT